MIIRQGDVFLERIKELPEGLTKVIMDEKSGALVLQYSEVSGNHHHFKSNAAVDLYQEHADPINSKTITPDYGKFIVVKENNIHLFHGKGFNANPVALKTGDHHALKIPPGIYRIGITPEYDEEEILQVVD